MAPSLRELASFIQNFDPDNDMEGRSYRLDTRNQLGIKNSRDPFDFYAFIPYGSWNNFENSPPTPNVLATAISEALEEGLKTKNYFSSPTGEKYVFVDMCNFLGYEVDFFHNDGANGIFDTLLTGVNNLPEDVTPVIRILAGGPNIKRADFSADEAGPLWERFANLLSKLIGFSSDTTGTLWTYFLELFWKNTDVPDPNGTLWRRYAKLFWKDGKKWHPKAQLYIGWYNPDHELDLGALASELKDLPEEILQYLEKQFSNELGGSLQLEHINKMTGFIRESVPALAHSLKVPGLPAISWNHAKLVAVNGVTMTVGGANQYNKYGDHQDDLFDSQFKIRGDSVLQGHRYADTMWSYLNTLPERDDDDSSMLFTRSLASSPPTSARDFSVSPAPLFNDMPQHFTNEGDQSVLTVSNVGDKLPYGVRYPLQSLNTVRDIILNLAWLKFLTLRQMDDLVYFGYKFLVEILSDRSIQHILQRYKISPVAWASKLTRLHVLENAKDNIILYQQELVNEDLKQETAKVNMIIQDLKQYLGLDWDGSIIPFDLLLAVAKGLKNIHERHPFDSSRGVHILISSVPDPNNQNYNAPYSWKKVAAILEKLLFACGVPDAAEVVKHRVVCKRIIKNDDRHHVHSKMVCVDKALLYAGSDNAYPQYNEQHGVWIEDKENITAWYDQFWTEAWDKSTTAED